MKNEMKKSKKAEKTKKTEKTTRWEEAKDGEVILSEYAIQKLEWLIEKSKGDEVGAVGITEEEQPLRVIDWRLMKQEVGGASVESEDLGELLEGCIDDGIEPECCMRIWVHTHPGFDRSPSGIDLRFAEEFFSCQPYGVMMIANENGVNGWLYTGGELKCLTEIKVSKEVKKPEIPEDWEKEFEDKVSRAGKHRNYGNYGGQPGFVGSTVKSGESAGGPEYPQVPDEIKNSKVWDETRNEFNFAVLDLVHYEMKDEEGLEINAQDLLSGDIETCVTAKNVVEFEFIMGLKPLSLLTFVDDFLNDEAYDEYCQLSGNPEWIDDVIDGVN